MRLSPLIVAIVSLPLLGGCVWSRQDPGRPLQVPGANVQVFAAGARYEGVVRAVSNDSVLVGNRWIGRTAIDSVRTRRAHAVPYVVGLGVVLPVAVVWLFMKSIEGRFE